MESDEEMQPKQSPHYGAVTPGLASDKIGAWAAAQYFVERQLKSSSTVDFPGYCKKGIIDVGTGAYVIVSYVDTQNPFGSTIRSHFVCSVLKVKGVGQSNESEWDLLSLNIE